MTRDTSLGRFECMWLKMGLLLAVCSVMAGCASMPPPAGPGRNLGYTPLGGSEPVVRQGGSARGARPWSSGAAGPQAGEGTRQAVLDAVRETSRSLEELADALRALEGRPPALRGVSGILERSIVYGESQRRWLQGALKTVTTWAGAAEEVHETDLQLALLRMSGPQLQGAMSGTLLLATWVDFVNLADAVLRQCPFYSAERLFLDLERVRQRMEPSMKALASGEPEAVEAAAAALPELLGQLTQEFHAIREGASRATERGNQVMAAAQFVEMLTMVSMLKVSLPRLPPAAPALTGVGLVMSGGGVMMGSQWVVSAEWVEMMRRLVQAGVISISAASAAVRIHAGLVLMAQTNPGLPRGVREALGDGPEVRAMHETGKAGAGMAEPPRHHVLPDEHRAWFEQRGFTGDMNIDRFCVRLEASKHQAIHGGGNWRLGRTWPGEWNRMIMEALREAELEAGRTLTRNEILETVARYMKDYRIPMSFVAGRRR